MKKATDKKTYSQEIKDWIGKPGQSALWEYKGIFFYKDDGWWNYQRPDGLTNWEIDGQPFKTLKVAKEYAAKSLETNPLK